MGLGWYYFGCGPREAGHYCWDHRGQRDSGYVKGAHINWGSFDGTLPPQPEREVYVASFSRLGGWGKAALSWWDRSQDKRPASNSTILCPIITATPAEVYAQAQVIFPWVFARLPQPLVLHANSERWFGPLHTVIAGAPAPEDKDAV